MTTPAWVRTWAPKALWVVVGTVVPLSVTTSYRAGATVERFQARMDQHDKMDTLILQRLNQLAGKMDSVKTTVDSLRWLQTDRERRSSTPLNPFGGR